MTFFMFYAKNYEYILFVQSLRVVQGILFCIRFRIKLRLQPSARFQTKTASRVGAIARTKGLITVGPSGAYCHGLCVTIATQVHWKTWTFTSNIFKRLAWPEFSQNHTILNELCCIVIMEQCCTVTSYYPVWQLFKSLNLHFSSLKGCLLSGL